MLVLLFVFHVLIAFALIGVIMLQKSEGGALGMGGGGMSGFMTGRSTANLLTRTTTYLAIAFFLTSIALVKLSAPGESRSIVNEGGPSPLIPAGPAAPTAPSPSAPAQPAPPVVPAQPAAPAAPSAPLAR